MRSAKAAETSRTVRDIQAHNRQLLRELREIGYANNVKRGKQDFHVQTEVMTLQKIKIKTTIHLRGAIMDALVRVVEASDDKVMTEVRKYAVLQHNNAVESVKNGKYD